MPKCDFNHGDIALWHECSPVNLLRIFRTPFPQNTYGRLLLKQEIKFAIKEFFTKSEQICSKLRISAHLNKETLNGKLPVTNISQD